MAHTQLTAGCKINLYLEILSRREDGYHELRTLFHPLPAPFDTLDITPSASGTGISLTCSRPELEGDGNLVAQAWHAFREAAGIAPDIAVHLTKRIPDGAGLGGGSSDAAALLQWLNQTAAELGGKSLEHSRLVDTALSLGADVPFFLTPQPAWAQGIGEQLAAARIDLSGFFLVLVCPAIKVPTGWAYSQWDASRSTVPSPPLTAKTSSCDDPATGSFLTTTPAEDMSPILRGLRLFNSFEEAVFPHHPQLRLIKEKLLAHGASGALMSGSGSSIFALFRNAGLARNAAENLGEDIADTGSVHLVSMTAGV